ncbi:MAG TPA: hypothetical protein PLB25_06960 [Rhodoferax sp.]|nr:hypothetical protein [Rhodoferax sp.]
MAWLSTSPRAEAVIRCPAVAVDFQHRSLAWCAGKGGFPAARPGELAGAPKLSNLTSTD